jgi:OFA family oxalate/formate antiporter-like MFS transporter
MPQKHAHQTKHDHAHHTQHGHRAPTKAAPNRWLQLVVGIVCMVMIANLQYGWTYFVNPMEEANHWGLPAIQWAFSLFVLTETWLIPIEGWFVDRYGPKVVVMVGGVIVAIGWALNSVATSLPLLYLGAIVSGIGAGCVYGTCVGNALKWFGDRRGLAAGLTAGGFGAGAAATVVPIINSINAYGYKATFLYFGLGQGIIILMLAPFLKAPEPGQIKVSTKKRVGQSSRSFTPKEMVRTPLFWVLYLMFTMVAAGGLMATAQLGPIARDFGLDKMQVVLFGIAGTTLVMAGIVDNILNGVARPFFGWVSDHIGREPTMFIAFTGGAFAMWGLTTFGHEPIAFIRLFGAIYCTWGEIYSLFPATCTDAFGPKYAATNAGLLYTAKGTAAIFGGPLAAYLVQASGSWSSVFWVSAIMDLIAAIMAITILKALTHSHHATVAEGQPTAPLPAE